MFRSDFNAYPGSATLAAFEDDPNFADTRWHDVRFRGRA